MNESRSIAENQMSPEARRTQMWRSRAAGLLLLVAPLGVMLADYAGPGRWWLNNWGASIFYELFFILVAFLIWPKRRTVLVAPVAVCVATVALEFLQLWNPAPLAAARATWLGRALLGHAFTWTDMPAYPLGCLCGWYLLRRIVALPPPVERTPR